MQRRFAPKHLARTAAAFTCCTRDPSGLKALRMTPSCGGRSLAQPLCNACIGPGALALRASATRLKGRRWRPCFWSIFNLHTCHVERGRTPEPKHPYAGGAKMLKGVSRKIRWCRNLGELPGSAAEGCRGAGSFECAGQFASESPRSAQDDSYQIKEATPGRSRRVSTTSALQ